MRVLIGKGAKFNPKNLGNIDYLNVNPLGWTGDAKIDELIVAVKQGKNINMDGRRVGTTLQAAATNT